MTVPSIPADIHPVEPGYRQSLRLRALLLWGVLLIAAMAADRLFLSDTPLALIAPILVAVLAAVAVLIVPQRVYRRLGFAIDGRMLRVMRGWLFHTDTIVPFVRVQHIDVTSGPIDKMFGIANLVVHTAGTHNSIVVLPGLSPDTASAIRDAIRAEIRADAE